MGLAGFKTGHGVGRHRGLSLPATGLDTWGRLMAIQGGPLSCGRARVPTGLLHGYEIGTRRGARPPPTLTSVFVRGGWGGQRSQTVQLGAEELGSRWSASAAPQAALLIPTRNRERLSVVLRARSMVGVRRNECALQRDWVEIARCCLAGGRAGVRVCARVDGRGVWRVERGTLC